VGCVGRRDKYGSVADVCRVYPSWGRGSRTESTTQGNDDVRFGSSKPVSMCVTGGMGAVEVEARQRRRLYASIENPVGL